jgi:hypothetical protein
MYTFGLIKEKKLYLTHEEYSYLVDIGYVAGEEVKLKDTFKNILYSYLKRATKMVSCLEHRYSDMSEYYVVYKDTDMFKSNTMQYVVKLVRDKMFTLDMVSEYLEKKKIIDEKVELLLAIVSSSNSVTFIKANTVMPMNI